MDGSWAVGGSEWRLWRMNAGVRCVGKNEPALPATTATAAIAIAIHHPLPDAMGGGGGVGWEREVAIAVIAGCWLMPALLPSQHNQPASQLLVRGCAVGLGVPPRCPSERGEGTRHTRPTHHSQGTPPALEWPSGYCTHTAIHSLSQPTPTTNHQPARRLSSGWNPCPGRPRRRRQPAAVQV